MALELPRQACLAAALPHMLQHSPLLDLYPATVDGKKNMLLVAGNGVLR